MNEGPHKDAKEIVEQLLDVTGTALLSGDFATFERAFDIPQVMAIAATYVRVENSDDLRAMFDRLREYLQDAGITEFERTCEFAEFINPYKIRATHISQQLAHGVPVQAPYPVNSVIRKVDDVWKFGPADYDIRADSKQAAAILRPHEPKAPATHIFRKMKSVRDHKADPKAMEIYQNNLDAVSAAIMNGPDEAALDHLRAPYYMRTSEGLQALNNRDDILRDIGSARLSLRVQSATDYVRTVRHAFFRSDTEIEGVHTTRILRGAELLAPPYDNRMKMVLSSDGKWQVIHAEHCVLLPGWPAVQDDQDVATLEDVNPLSQADEIALLVYQEYLDALTESNVTRNFGAWVALCSFPHTVIIDRVTRVIETPQDISEFFEMLSNLLNDNPAATMKRTGEFATFVNSHTIKGYHQTTISDGKSDVIAPVRGCFTIALEDGKWRMIETVNAIANNEFPYKTPIVSEALGSELDPTKDLTK